MFDLKSNALRPATYTSADAAGLPILPGLVRYDEVASGAINHAIRITVPTSQKAYIWPARHQAGSTTNTNYPRMGEWFRLKATVDPITFDPAVRPIIVALQKYGAHRRRQRVGLVHERRARLPVGQRQAARPSGASRAATSKR